MAGRRKVRLDSEALIYYRERRMLTQEELAKKAKLSEGTISRLENEHHGARFSTINKLAKALRIDPEDLLHPPNRNGHAA